MTKPMTPYEVWVMANTIRLHFNSKSDIKGMLYRVFTQEKFEKAPERFVCKRLSENVLGKRNLSIFVASNLVYDPSIWFHSLETADCKRRYIEARRNLDAPVQSIKMMLNEVQFSDIVSGSPLPNFISGLMSGKYTPEQICILDIASPFIQCSIEKNDNVVVASMSGRLAKYRSFCSIKDAQTRDTIKNLIASNGE